VSLFLLMMTCYYVLLLIILVRNAADLALSQKLAEELQYETETNGSADPDFLKSFKAQGVWTVREVFIRVCQTLFMSIVAGGGCRRKRRSQHCAQVWQRDVSKICCAQCVH
jgi:hypothetical protein